MITRYRHKSSTALRPQQMLLVLSALLFLSAGTCSANDASTAGSMLRSDPHAAEAFYRPLIVDDTKGDAYAGLGMALCRQGNVAEAEQVLQEARNKGFFDNPQVLAASGFVSEANAHKPLSRARKDLYDEVALMLSQRALKIDPTNEVALETIKLANKNRLTYTRSYPAGVVLRQGSPPAPGPGQIPYGHPTGDFGSDRLFFVPGRGLRKDPDQADDKSEHTTSVKAGQGQLQQR